MNKYDKNDLVTLSPGRAYREKLGMYLDSDKQKAINLGLRELVVNAQDEFSVYKPKDAHLRIILSTENRIITVEDNLRGLPVGIREDGQNSLIAACLIPHSGAKHEEGAYSSAVGVNGQGLKVVTHTAESMRVMVYRDGKLYQAHFNSDEEGAKLDGEIIERKLEDTSKTGTRLIYVPDKRVYGDIFIDVNSLREMLKELSLFARGLKITLEIDGGEAEEFLSKNGLVDGLNNPNAISKPFSHIFKTDDCEVELALQWVSKRGNVKGYANGLHMPEGGAFITGFKTALTRQFNLLSQSKFKGEDIRAVLDGYVSVKVKVGNFSNQQKTALGNPEAQVATSKATTACLKEFYSAKRKDFEKIVELLTKLEKAEKAADRARDAILNANREISKNQVKLNFASKKLRDAEFLGEDSILLVVEGNSAAGSMSIGRDTKKYGILELRGKIINALCHPLEKVLENEEVKLIMSALGVSYNNYNNKKLRYGKVAIAVDADNDGAHIACLIISFFERFFPEFLQEGRLCWLRPPLYRVTKGKKSHYFYSDEELNNSNITGAQTRFKG